MESSDLANILRYTVGITLLAAGIAKLQNFTQFVEGVLHYQVLPPVLARWYGYILPAAEIGTSIFLIFGVWVKFAAIAAGVMFGSFAIAVALNLWRKRQMPCYCFGADVSDNIGRHTLVRIFLLMFFTISLLYIWPAEISSRSYSHIPSLTDLVSSIPTVLLVIFGLSILSIIEVSPWVIRAWTTPAIGPTQDRINVIWTREEEIL